jgi:hypothetical protein
MTAAPASAQQDQRDKIDRYAAALLAIEQAAVRAAIGHLVATLAMLRRQANAAAILQPAALEQRARQLAEQLEAQTRPILRSPALTATIERQAQAAIDLAVRTLAAQPPPQRLTPEPEAGAAMDAALATAQDRIGSAVKLLTRADDPQDLITALHAANGAAAAVATGAEYAVNQAANSGPRRVAVALGQKLVWVAERDACVVCAALSGDVIDPNEGEGFDEDATFDSRPPPPVWPPGMPLMQPPRHPHCRCVAQVWEGSLVPGFYAWPSRLKHEALRSVARGWSLPSESNAARLRAAHRILGSGAAAQLPKSVRAEAVRAVATGAFASRQVP